MAAVRLTRVAEEESRNKKASPGGEAFRRVRVAEGIRTPDPLDHNQVL